MATPDPSLRHCEPRPSKPVLHDDTDISTLIVDLDERGVDCSAKLDSTWKSIDDAVEAALKLNAEEAKKTK